MSMQSLIKDYATFNLWANTQLVNFLRTKPPELMLREVPSSYPSLKMTARHIWETEQFWLAVIQRNQGAADAQVEDSVDAIFNLWLSNAQELSDFVNGLSTEELEEEVFFTTPWVEASKPRHQFIHHVLNHSMYHRGQLVTIGRVLGFTDAPMTDYNFYLLMTNR